MSLWAKFPYQFLRNWNIRLGRISLLSTSELHLSKLPLFVTLPKSTFKKVKTQIQKDANPEKAVRRGYDTASDYFEMLNKTILTQQRALACLHKSLAHILQRELYGQHWPAQARGRNDLPTTLRGYETSGTEEFALLNFLIIQVSASKGGRTLPPQKGTSKDSQGFAPYQNKPFRGPHNKKRGSYR